MPSEPDTGDIRQWVERRRSALEGNPTEFARGYESALDDFEKQADRIGSGECGSG